MTDETLRQRVLGGETVRGAMVFECFSPGISQVLKLAGAEFAMFDMEHTGLGFETLKMLIATCRGMGLTPMARVPRGEYHFLARALDVGAHGVMIPMVESVEQARRIVESTRYPPTGRRGAAFGFAHDDYTGGDVHEKMKRLDARNLIIAQIETERGLDAVEDIAAVDGIDVLWIGHFDLTNFLGIPAQFENKIYLDALTRVVAAGRTARRGLGFMATDPETAIRYRKLGFNMLAAGIDQNILMSGYKAILAPLATGVST